MINIRDGNFKVVARRENSDDYIFTTINNRKFQGFNLTNDGGSDILIIAKMSGVKVFDSNITVKAEESYMNYFEFDSLEVTANANNYRIEVYQ